MSSTDRRVTIHEPPATMNDELRRALARAFPDDKVKQKRGQGGRGAPKSAEHRAKIKAAVQATKTRQSLSSAVGRFLTKVVLVEHTPGDYCWEWQGSKDKDGYGYFSLRGKTIKAHRFAFEHWIGPIPEGLVPDHICRNTSCVCPWHLEPKTNRENILTGEGVAAKNARKTHCQRGHEFTPENTYLHGRGRHCRTCRSDDFAALPSRRGNG